MITRSKTYGSVTISATFAWDRGDPSAGIPAGLGEDTCVEITAGPIRTWLTWNDHDPETHAHADDPARWVVDSIETDFEGKQSAHVYDCHSPGRILRLSELPEVLSVVQDAYEAWGAAERLSAAQETAQYADELRYMADNPEMAHEMGYSVPEPVEIEREVRVAAAEMDEAQFNALRTGVTNRS